jgi:hypothetical protein
VVTAIRSGSAEAYLLRAKSARITVQVGGTNIRNNYKLKIGEAHQFFFYRILLAEKFFVPLPQITTELPKCAAALKYSKIQAAKNSKIRRKPKL